MAVEQVPMVTKPNCKSEAFEAIHSAVLGMASAGTISRVALREFSEICLDKNIELAPGRSERISSNAGAASVHPKNLK
ncbi:hypothetical protein IHQ71_16000 [Rhizobium sp. TH2]|uniref:hypothetical protein n=1 Tax=Rhizobium sp. TH2 TaxID=2775403 RepID=UPI0021583A52|nr:hypothetical protein [Rhizobium sp. TH2]UVC06757.1 hypothetical protein IHQ71_16000 [Rhizobium sp. TH2]